MTGRTWAGRGAAIAAGGLALALAAPAVWRRLRAMNMRGQVVLITGASRGLGLALAREFAHEGARLVICARSAEELTWARDELAAAGAEVLAVSCDIGNRQEVERLVHAATDRFGHIDVLVNNAGVIVVGPLESQTLDDFEEAMRVMFWGPLYATLAVLPGIRERGSGRIVNITSIGGKISVPHLLSYSAAKFAHVGLSEGLRAELAGTGVAVTTVVPGLMRTGSPPNAWFKGKHREEYRWFFLSDSLPFTSISARRAARQIVAAARRGDPELTISIQAQLASRFHGLLPGLAVELAGIASRLLPAMGGVGTERVRGTESETAVTESFVTRLGREAALRYHQYLSHRFDAAAGRRLEERATIV